MRPTSRRAATSCWPKSTSTPAWAHSRSATCFSASGSNGAQTPRNRCGGDSAPTGADEAQSAEAPQDAPAEADIAPKARTPRAGTKQAKLIEMLRAEGGATIDEILAATGWQSHSVRGAFAGALRKKLGLTITSEKIEGRGRVYSLPRD